MTELKLGTKGIRIYTPVTLPSGYTLSDMTTKNILFIDPDGDVTEKTGTIDPSDSLSMYHTLDGTMINKTGIWKVVGFVSNGTYESYSTNSIQLLIKDEYE
jgi:hypothetical protein